MALAGEPSQLVDPLADVLLRQRRVQVDEPGDLQRRRVGAIAAELVGGFAVLRRPVVVDALALTAILDGVLDLALAFPAERVESLIEEPEEAGGSPARLRESRQIVVEVELQEVPMLPQVPRRRVRIAERVVLTADRLGADACRRVRTQAELISPRSSNGMDQALRSLMPVASAVSNINASVWCRRITVIIGPPPGSA